MLCIGLGLIVDGLQSRTTSDNFRPPAHRHVHMVGMTMPAEVSGPHRASGEAMRVHLERDSALPPTWERRGAGVTSSNQRQQLPTPLWATLEQALVKMLDRTPPNAKTTTRSARRYRRSGGRTRRPRRRARPSWRGGR
jgi:hypothetical protein